MTWTVHSSWLLRFSPHLMLLQYLTGLLLQPLGQFGSLHSFRSQRKCSPISPSAYVHKSCSHFFCSFIPYSLSTSFPLEELYGFSYSSIFRSSQTSENLVFISPHSMCVCVCVKYSILPQFPLLLSAKFSHPPFEL